MGCNRSIKSFIARLFNTRSFISLYCTIADRGDRFATSISLREHASERYADRFDVYEWIGAQIWCLIKLIIV